MSRSFGGTRLTTRAADRDLALGDLLEPGDHPQQRRLAAAGRADQHAELAVGDRDVDAADHVRRAEVLLHRPNVDGRHRLRLPRIVSLTLATVTGARVPARDDVVRPARRKPGDDVLRRLAPQLLLRLDRKERRVRRQDHARMAERAASRAAPAPPAARRAPAPPACRASSAASAASTSTTAPRAVLTRYAPGFIAPKHVGVDHAARLGVERHVQRDDVALARTARRGCARSTYAGKVAVDEVGIAGDDALEHVARDVRHPLADAAQADDAERHVATAARSVPDDR